MNTTGIAFHLCVYSFQYFLIAVSWNDQTQVSVHRKWKQITKFQRNLIRVSRLYSVSIEADLSTAETLRSYIGRHPENSRDTQWPLLPDVRAMICMSR